MRLIDADKLEAYGTTVPKECNAEDYLSGVRDVLEHIDSMPTVDAIPVRHGKWIDSETFKRPWFRHHIFECSVCRNTLDMDGVNAGRGDANYCPNCGADMRGEKE